METMNTRPNPDRPRWPIDHQLATLVGHPVRVAVEAFAPIRWDGTSLAPWVPVRGLLLPDNTAADGHPVFFEGRLDTFERRIGVVHLTLAPSPLPDPAPEGLVPFRGTPAVVLQGPALVRLAFPFQIERLPLDPANYWRDLRFPAVQFEWSLSYETRIQTHP